MKIKQKVGTFFKLALLTSHNDSKEKWFGFRPK